MNILMYTIILLAFLAVAFLAFREIRKYLPSGTLMTYGTSPCRGPCPVFSLTIDGNGNATYTGSDFVRVKGRHRFSIPKTEVKELVDEFLRIDYFSLKDTYRDKDIYDIPGFGTSFTYRGRSKSITRDNGGPDELIALERRLEEIVTSRGFIS